MKKLICGFLCAFAAFPANTSVFAEALPEKSAERIAYVIKECGRMPKMMTAGFILLAITAVITVMYYKKTGGKDNG